MRYEPFELKGLKLEKEYESTFPVLIQLVQNTKESTDREYYGTIGNYYNLAYSIELPGLLENDKGNSNRNFVKLNNALNNLKSVKLSRHDLFKDFYVIKISDYSSTSRSIGSYEFLPLVFMKRGDNYEKIPQNRVGLIKNFTSKEAFIIIDKGASNYTFNDLVDIVDDFIVDIYFKRRTIKNSDTYTSTIESHDGNSITFKITNNNVDGKLSPIDLNRIRFTYDGTYLINSALFAKIEVINSSGETIELNRQLTADDYFKFLYKSNYKDVNFAAYQKPANTFSVKYTLLTNLLPINNNNYTNFNIVLSENTPWYYQYTSKAGVSFNKNNAIYWKTANNLGRLLITNNIEIEDNSSLFEVFPDYDNYERFVDVVHVTSDIANFDIHKYLLKQKVFNYDSDGFLEVFNRYEDGTYVKSPNNTVKDNSFISFRFSNEYKVYNTILDTTITPYGDEITSMEISGFLVDSITIYNFVKRVNGKDICCGVFGDPTLNVISQNITSSKNNIIYPLDGDNERVQKVIGEEEIRSYKTYKNNKDFINIGFSTKENSSEELSDFRMSDDNENSVAVNMIRKKHAEAINRLYDKFNPLQTEISVIKNKLKARMPANKVLTKSTDKLLYNNFSTKYLLIKPNVDIEYFDIKITNSRGEIIKREYNCALNDKGFYILLPYYIMTTNSITNDRSGSGYIGPLDNADFYIECCEHLTDKAISFYYEEGV